MAGYRHAERNSESRNALAQAAIFFALWRGLLSV
mgnify:CR=1 FL=1